MILLSWEMIKKWWDVLVPTDPFKEKDKKEANSKEE